MPSRSDKILAAFSMLYPEPKSELNYRNEFELVVAVVLSAQCTDKKVNQVTPQLFSRFPNFSALAKAAVTDVEALIRQVNYYRTKSKNIVGLANDVVVHYNGKLPHGIDELIKLPGVGRKTASVVTVEQGGEALPVDTHVFRVSKRLGFSAGESVEEVEADLRAQFAPAIWHDLHHWLIFHGRRVCSARSPNCESCQIAKLCPARKV